ncbi:MAG: family 43 glycosylhydrolase, partial [Lachnospiraceae bacterium]|nr:family 43 glycosylhydrolase [Lachnospiraceae bacterium]
MRKALRNGWKRVCSVVLAAAMVVTMLPANTQAAIASSDNGDGTFSNPAIYADVPDADIIRVGNAYYMVSTTMQFSPGCPIMKSADLVNWEIVNYVYDVLGDTDAMSLRNGENMYGMGQEAASLKFHNGTYYAAFNAGMAGEAYIFTTKDIENGTWEKHVIKGDYKDLTLFFDGDKAYIVYGAGEIKCAELGADFTVTAEKPLFSVVTGDNAAGKEAGGTHILKKDGYYYVFHAVTTSEGSQQICHRTQDFLSGNWEEKVILDADFDGYGSVAQGGVIDTADGKWYAYLSQERGALGSVPVLTDCTWKENWPMLGKNGDGKTVEKTMSMAVVTSGDGKALVKSDEFYNGGKQAEAASAKQAELYAAGETGDTGTGEAEELVEFVSNGNFEEGTLEGWASFGWPQGTKFERTADPKSERGQVLRVYDRTSSGGSASYDVSGKLQAGKKYVFSGKILYTEGPDTHVFHVTFQNGIDYNFNHTKYGLVTAKKGEWTEFTYEYTPEEGEKFTTTRNIFAIEGQYEETGDNGSKVAKFVNYYLDDISLKGP